MAKKTNKTSHVLNLLSGGAADAEKPKSDNVTVDNLAKDDPLAQNIKNSLLLDLGESIATEKEISIEQTDRATTVGGKIAEISAGTGATVEISPEIKAEVISETKSDANPPGVLAEGGISDPRSDRQVREADLVQFAPVSTAEEEEVSIEEAFDSASAVSNERIISERQKIGEDEVKRLSDSLGKDDFEFLSVMEYIIEQEIHKFMEEFGVCDCSRCTADVMALSLTNLPAKFVVAAKDSVSPILNFYSKKYATEVTVALTNACVQVSEHPHHVRPR